MPYAELHAKTNFSFLEGASHPEEMVRRAGELGYAALAVTDRSSLAGVVRAHGTAKEAGVKLLVGAEVTPDDAPPAVLRAATIDTPASPCYAGPIGAGGRTFPVHCREVAGKGMGEPMPTILRAGPYRFYFHSHEPNEPPHVHVDRDELSARFWLEPVGLARNFGFSPKELRRIQIVVGQHQASFLEAWHGHLGTGG